MGDFATVGANAFVINRDVPGHATVAGTPARVVKQRGVPVDEPLPPMTLLAGAEPVELAV